VDHIPFGTIVLMVLIDVVVVLGLSAASGLMVSRGAGTAAWKGALVGVLVPIAGPVIHGVVAMTTDRGTAAVRRLAERSAVAYAGAAALTLSAVCLLVGMVISWGQVEGGYEDYALATNAAAADTGFGLVASVATAGTLVAGAAVVLGWTAWRRVAIVAIALGSAWLLLAVDAAMVFNAIGRVTEGVDGISGGRANAVAEPGGGLWLALTAGLLAVGAGLALGFARPATDSRTPVAPTIPEPQPATVTHDQDWGSDWSSVPGGPEPDAADPSWDWGSPRESKPGGWT
jgi:hypothetical protein